MHTVLVDKLDSVTMTNAYRVTYRVDEHEECSIAGKRAAGDGAGAAEVQRRRPHVRALMSCHTRNPSTSCWHVLHLGNVEGARGQKTD